MTYDADFGVTLGAFWGHFGVTLGIDVDFDVNANLRHICAGLVGPKIENVLPTTARSKFLKGQGSHEGVRTGSKGAGRTIFWGHFGHFGVTFESVWVSVGDFRSVHGDFAMIVGSL